MKHFYDNSYWAGDGQMLWQARRLLATILAITEDDATLPAPHMAPMVDYYRSTAWQGFCATWFADNGHTLEIRIHGDALEIWASDAAENTVFRYAFSNREAGAGNPSYPYRRYSAERLSVAIGAAKRWCVGNRDHLGTIEDSIDQLFFGAPASTREQAWESEWGGYLHQDKMLGIRKLFCLTQATRPAGSEMPFFSYGATGEDGDGPIFEWVELDCEWAHTGSGHQTASIQFFNDGDFMFYGRDDVMSEEGYKLSRVFGQSDSEAEPLTRDRLLGAIESLRTWLPTALPDRKVDSRLFFECGLVYNEAQDDWQNFFCPSDCPHNGIKA